ncbi:MAG: class I SAM-dependent methyltransferase [Methanobacteriota archaeon]
MRRPCSSSGGADLAAHGPRPAAPEPKAIAALLAEEGVPYGGKLLDVPCGIGRRAVGLAEEGFDVTAVDANATGIEAASGRIPPGLASRLRFRHDDRPSLPRLEDARFDAVLSLDHPIGRGDGPDDVAFLRRLAEVAGPEGRLVLELFHRDFFAVRPKPFSFHVVGSLEQHEFRGFDPVTGELDLTWRFYERVGQDLRHRGDSHVRIRLLAPHEARALLASAGWSVARVYGGWTREAVGAERRKLILVARPAARD